MRHGTDFTTSACAIGSRVVLLHKISIRAIISRCDHDWGIWDTTKSGLPILGAYLQVKEVFTSEFQLTSLRKIF